ncbi:MAG: thymidine phosphorylase [Thermodesulfovibrionales bacterium]|nr:thymidine phosphorylase [Thermodesulfovibrionales bacterium]
MTAYELIKKKRDGEKLSREELEFLIRGYTEGRIPDYQISAFLMAVYFQGMSDEETFNLTDIMLRSGRIFDLSFIEGVKIDKHSTGGVGDKVSIILAPLLASAGIIVPMISGRGLGHTGGTADKLESIPGFRVNQSYTEFVDTVEKIGFAMATQGPEIAPADGRLYSLRDVTATVDSIPLIASSIMSKKLAEGIDGLVLDIKCGSGAFMKDTDKARKLAELMVTIGNKYGVKTVALITDMSEPLGKTVGNSLEIKESILALRGKWPEDLKEVTLNLGAWALWIRDKISGNETREINEYIKFLEGLIEDGSAFSRFVELLKAQGGNPEIAFRQGLLPSARFQEHILSPEEGYISALDAELVGGAAVLLGAGRRTKEESIDHAAGIVLNKKVGDFVKKGEPLAIMHFNKQDSFEEAKALYIKALKFSSEPPGQRKKIIEVII